MKLETLEKLRTLATGDLAHREELFFEFMPIVFRVTKNYSKFYNMYEDIQQSGILALLEVLKSIGDGNIEVSEGIVTYIWKRVDGAIKEFIIADQIIPIPKSALQKAIKNDTIDDLLKRYTPISMDQNESENDEDIRAAYEVAAPDVLTQLKIDDFLKPFSAQERVILGYLYRGYDMVEIAKEIGVSKQRVFNLVATIIEKHEARQHVES